MLLRLPEQNFGTHFTSNQRLNGPVVQLARNTRPFFGPYSRTYAAQQIDAVDGRGKLEQERLKETQALLSIRVLARIQDKEAAGPLFATGERHTQKRTERMRVVELLRSIRRTSESLLPFVFKARISKWPPPFQPVFFSTRK